MGFQFPAPRLLLRLVRCRACGRFGATEALECPWCGESVALSAPTRRDCLVGGATFLSCLLFSCHPFRPYFQNRPATLLVAAVAAFLSCPATAGKSARQGGGDPGDRSGGAACVAFSALTVAFVALFRAVCCGQVLFESRDWRIILVSTLAAIAAFAVLRFPALPPLSSTLRPAVRFKSVAVGSAAAFAPVFAAAVSDPGLAVAAVAALTRTASSTSPSLALAYAAVCARWTPEPGAFATFFAVFAAVFVAKYCKISSF